MKAFQVCPARTKDREYWIVARAARRKFISAVARGPCVAASEWWLLVCSPWERSRQPRNGRGSGRVSPVSLGGENRWQVHEVVEAHEASQVFAR